MIPLSVAEIAAITVGRLSGKRWRRWNVPVTGPVVIDSRQAVSRARCSPRCPASAWTATTTPPPPSRTARPPSSPPGRCPGSARRSSSSPTSPSRSARWPAPCSRRLPGVTVVGITGSSGKTSTKDLTAQVVERLGPTIAPEGSLNNEIGLPLTVLRADETTRYLILEMSARGIGHIAYLAGIAPPRIGAVLNVGRAHAGEFGSIDAVAKAKGELVEALPAAADGRRGGAQRRRPQRRSRWRRAPRPAW